MIRCVPLAMLLGCSLGTYDFEPCTTNAECRGAFGFGSMCTESGYCEAAPLDERCLEAWPEDLLTRPENYKDTIVFGSMYDHSTDVPETLATQLPIMQVNDYGGLDGHDFGLVQCDYAEDLSLDDKTAEEAAAATALYLADTLGVPAIIGPATSSEATTAYTALHGATDYDVVLISPSASSTSLTNIDGVEKSEEAPGLFWRTVPPDDLQGAVIARLVTEAGYDRVVCLHEAGPYGQGLYESFDMNYAGASDEVTFADQSAMVESVTSDTEGYDAVLFFAGDSNDIAAFLNAASALDYFEDMPIFVADAARDTDLLEAAQGAEALFKNIVGTAPAVPTGDVYDAFAAAYASQYAPSEAADSVYTPYCYDATWLALFGSAWSLYGEEAIHGLGIARGLRHISAEGWTEQDQIVLRPTAWADLVAYATDTSDVNVVGPSGELEYDPTTGETSGAIDVWRITPDHQGFETTATIEP